MWGDPNDSTCPALTWGSGGRSDQATRLAAAQHPQVTEEHQQSQQRVCKGLRGGGGVGGDEEDPWALREDFFFPGSV